VVYGGIFVNCCAAASFGIKTTVVMGVQIINIFFYYMYTSIEVLHHVALRDFCIQTKEG
jgi:hypothetical protein